jgi:hypothetical protein
MCCLLVPLLLLTGLLGSGCLLSPQSMLLVLLTDGTTAAALGWQLL